MGPCSFMTDGTVLVPSVSRSGETQLFNHPYADGRFGSVIGDPTFTNHPGPW